MTISLRSSLFAAAIVSVAGTASAADMPSASPMMPTVAPIASWTGFYIGLNAGYGWANSDGSTTLLPTAALFGVRPFTSSTDLDGFLGGVQAGYNWQADNFVVGVEADIDYANLDGNHLVTPLSTFAGVPVPGWFQRGTGDMDWFGTVRARAGFLATPEMLIYATGGFAFARTSYSTFTSFTPLPPFQYAGSADETNTGWTVGAGVEWAFASNWTVKAEYLYFDLGDTNYIAYPLAPNPPFAVAQSFENNGSIVRLGVNYKFSSY